MLECAGMLAGAPSIARTLASYRYNFEDELDLQNGIAAALSSNLLSYEKEYRLGEHDRPDFFLPSIGLVIEVKVKFRRAEVLRQLLRYAGYPEVKSLLLVTSRSCHGVPDSLNSKPALVLNVGRL